MNQAPLAIQRLGTALHLTWADGSASLLEGAALRGACRCAACVQQARAGSPVVSGRSVTVTDASPVGHYGVQLHFSDGHTRGIYPWSYLRDIAARGHAA